MMLISELRVHPKNIEVYGDENVDDLIKSIKEIGIQHALIVTTSGLIISGNRRYKAARLIGLKEVPVDIRVYKNELDEWEALLECNKQREKTKEQMGAEGDLYDDIERKRAEERMLGGIKIDPGEPVPQGRGPRSRDIIAQKVGLGSGRHYEQVQVVRTAIKDLPEEQAKVLKVLLEKSTKTAYRIVQEGLVDKLTPDIIVKLQDEDFSAARIYHELAQEEREEKVKWMAPIPEGEFNVILADPPWKYDFSATENREIENQYPTMEVEQICALSPPAAENSILFLWATNPKLREAFEVIKAWNFEYKTNFVWVKDKIGMGYYGRGRHELLLISTKGAFSPPVPENRPDSVIEAPRTDHSKKPDIVYELIEKMYPGHKYLELFAREKRDKWTSWGADV